MNNDRGGEAEVCDEFVQNAYQEYSLEIVADLLWPTGLLIDETAQYVGSFEQYVFLNGNISEVYTQPEIDFIDKVSDIFVFKDYLKKTKRNSVPCRVIAVRIDWMDIVSAGIAFTKIVNKAMDGMNICLTISNEGLLFAGRIFSKKDENSCFVSEVIKNAAQYEKLVSELIFAPVYEDFIEYYSYVKAVIQYKEEQWEYSDRFNGVCRVPYSYIDVLLEIEKVVHIDFSHEIERMFNIDDGQKELNYADRVKDCEEYLFKVSSSKINTMEILFEAEEMERLASETEIKNSEILQQNLSKEENRQIGINEETKELLNDPESIIKMLKKKRGL